MMEFETLPKNIISEQLVQTSKSLQSFRDKSLFTDVILCAGDEELPCHKAVLAASSAYFLAMFSSPYREQQTSRVKLDYISPWALRRLLDFAYLGCLEITETTVQDVFLAASLLDYPIAVKYCVDFMKNHLDVTNCLGIEALAEMHNLTDLAQSSHKLAVENFSSLLMESNEWTNLPISTVISYVSSDNLDVPSEQFVWDACINWVDQFSETRIAYLPQLLSHIRLKYLEKEMLEIQLQENPLIIECRSAQNIIKHFLHNVYNKDDNTSMFINNLPPRPATLKRPTLVVLGGLNTCILNCMQSFSPSRTVWQTCPSMPVDSLAWFSVIVVANTLFVIGGIKAGALMDTVYAYSPTRSTWSQRKCMPQARARHSTVSVGSRYIFVFGGVTMSVNSSHNQHSSNRVIPNHSREISSLSNGRNHNSSQLSVFNLNLSANDSDIPTINFEKSIIRYDICNDTWLNVGETDNPRLESHVVLVSESNDNTNFSRQSSDGFHEMDSEQNSLPSDLPDTTSVSENNITTNNSNGDTNLINKTRRRNNSMNVNLDRVFVEIGGITESQPQGTDQVAFYRLRPDYTVVCAADYIKLPQQVRYVNCCVHQDSNLLYIFWESTSELSVLDLGRHTLRSLAPLVSTSTSSSSQARIHAGISWVGELLYVVGGFSEYVGDDRRPTLPRDDVHCYDPTTNKWSRIKVLNATVPRAIFGCVCLNM
ncbi:Kelch-like protein isoform 4 [Schistosoma japonicum]|uniref:Kelch-like protein isoform 4 n=2 Tax=Schistosoma japonicum TaxID=6182 RepID=A0A4Z2CLC6_SCHJA|nr:Kelch-like protein isoform 4 [Schistosoma japonicum]